MATSSWVHTGTSASARPSIDPALEGVSTPPNGGEVSDVGPASDTVPMLSPDGRSGDIPFKNVDAAKAAGFKVAVTMRSPDGLNGYIPAENVQAAAAKGFTMVPMDVPDAAKASYWDALTNPVGSGGRDQGLLGGALQVGGQAVKAMAQPFLHPIDTLKGAAKVASDAVINGPAAAIGTDLVDPAVQQYMQDKQQGGNALAAENLGGQLLGNIEGGRVMGAAVSGIKPSAALGPAGEAPVAGAEGPVNTVGGVNRLIPEAVRNGTLPSAWDFVNNRWHPKSVLTGDVNAPIPGTTDLTPAARYASMKSVGVQPDAAEATNSTPLNAAKWLNENSLTSQANYTRAHASNLAALNRFTDRLLDTMSPVGSEEGGAAVQQGLLASHADLKAAATEAFKDLDSQVGNQPLPGAAGLRQQAQAILDENAPYYKLHPELEPTKAMAIVRDLADAKGNGKAAPAVVSGFGPASAAPEAVPPRVPTYSELHRLRSDLLDFNNTNPDLVKNQANGWISQLAGAADNAITSGESALTPDQVETFRNANDAWKYMKATYDNPQHPFYNAVRTPDASTLVKGIRQTPEMAKALQAALGPDGIGPIQRGVAENLLATTKEGGYNFKTFQGRWNKLPEAYRNALFTPEQVQQFEDIGNAGTVLHEDLNPSGSAKMGLKYGEMGEAGAAIPAAVTGHPLALGATAAYHATQYALGKFMNSPIFVDWLMRDQGVAAGAHTPAVNPTGPAAAAGAAMGSRTGPLGQPNYYSDEYLRSKAAFDATRVNP